MSKMNWNFFIYLFVLIPLLLNGQTYTSHTIQQDGLKVKLSEGILNIQPIHSKAVRIQWTKDLTKEEHEFVLVNQQPVPQFNCSETTSLLKLVTNEYSVLFDKKTSRLSFLDKKGKVILTEALNSRKLSSNTIHSEPCYIAEQGFDSKPDEYLFGLGQFQDGHYNLKNLSRKLIQVNSQIALPFLYSSKGYGILWHQYGLSWFNPADNIVNLNKESDTDSKDREVTSTSGTQKVSQQQTLYTGEFHLENDGEYTFMLDLGDMDNRHLLVIDGQAIIDQSNLWLPPAVSAKVKLKAGIHNVQVVCKSTNKPSLNWRKAGAETTFRSPNAKSLDYVVFLGEDADDIISTYRDLSGKVPMLPKWAFGYWQCRERYTSSSHLVETVKEFRKRQLPLDVIVQDWQYWGKYGWGVPKFDEANYPNPSQFIKELHDLNAKFSISVWENLDKKSSVAKDYEGLYIKDSPWIDIYNPQTQKVHWNALNQNLFMHGVDSWWMDATEPENDALKGKDTYFGQGEFYRLTYPLFVSKAVYEGQREANLEKRVTILTRSAFPGQQRYGTINWSGDIGWDWDAFKRQIVAGLNFSLTGMPYWTTDIGGFFRPGASQYYDPKYHDILMRWFQWGVFCPIFRMHGYQSETEPWKYGEKVEAEMRELLNLRYQLLPYIYSLAGDVNRNNTTLMRPMVMDFKGDEKAIKQPYQYMFGPAILVAPVVKPEIEEWKVYLPEGSLWFDFWTNKIQKGGREVMADASKNKIPLFIKSGSIIPLGPVMQHSSEKSNEALTLNIYGGSNGFFELYEDEGDNYNYEKGRYTVIPISWNEKKRSLMIGKRVGTFQGSIEKREFNIRVVGLDGEIVEQKVIYEGNPLSLKI